jgi:hypothetical protein
MGQYVVGNNLILFATASMYQKGLPNIAHNKAFGTQVFGAQVLALKRLS